MRDSEVCVGNFMVVLGPIRPSVDDFYRPEADFHAKEHLNHDRAWTLGRLLTTLDTGSVAFTSLLIVAFKRSAQWIKNL